GKVKEEAVAAQTSSFATNGDFSNASQQGCSSGLRRRRLGRSLLRGLVVAEFHCSVALRRRMDWAHVNMWPSELPPRSTVVLGGRDNLVPVREVRRMLANRAALLGPAHPHPRVLFREDLGHGGFLTDVECQTHVIAAALGVSLQTVRGRVSANAVQQQTSEPQKQEKQVTLQKGTQVRSECSSVPHIPLAVPP
ncbi:hypothetical protein VaNZ11_002596, partial [Volvox africanus]